MITEITQEQEAAIPIFVEKWLNVASRPMDKETAKRTTREIYKRIGEKPPTIVFGDSPLSTAIKAAIFFDESKLDSKLHLKLHLKLGSELHSKLGSELHSKLRSEIRSINNCWYMTFWWLALCGYYDYVECLGVKYNKNTYNLFVGFVSEVSFIIPFKGIAFISKKPTEIHWEDNVLHNENGAAVLYEDGYGLWALNGVTVAREIVETPADKLNPSLILTEKNAEIRREIVRKIGIERVCQKLKTETLDKKGDYELLKLQIPEMGIEAIYLKMKNPSIDTFHVEGVPPDIKTCEEAINWRAFGDVNIQWNPSQLT